jgi:hypothetical protein
MYSSTGKCAHQKKFYIQPTSVDTQLLKEIIDLLNKNTKMSIIKPLIDKLDPFSSVMINYTDSTGLMDLIKLTKLQIEQNVELERKLLMRHYITRSFNTTIKTVINFKYIKYVQKYGMPEDGIFVQELLDEFN